MAMNNPSFCSRKKRIHLLMDCKGSRILEMEKDKLEHFMNGFAAATKLLNRAGQNGFLVEYVCLATSVIDAVLRIGIILKYQLKNKTDEVLDELLYMEDEDKIVSEREVYRKAREQDIIDEESFEHLNHLYKKRNRVVHRYIISNITTRKVLDIAIQYERLIPVVSKQIATLEEQQLELGIGMTIAGSEVTKSQLDRMAAEKHDDNNLSIGLG